MLIDFVPTVGGLLLAEAPALKKAAVNVAVGISGLGGSLAFIGKVGEDEFGICRKLWHSFCPDARTALAFVTLRVDGECEFSSFCNPGTDMLLCELELDMDLIKKGSIFHYGSISLIEEPCRSTHLAAMNVAGKIW
ncbi:hypothetical protein GIB67_025388 [Kingdonia uniflora]|uniref:Carbohydrate kinase PfkB domain-containing protein n=1 Tax=Kingdonia uniflora TaxID=39325 RepID=A0A7J7NC63_9MAGN|nr:hypothetical protein GIB67_025388 [Kingdonia uniflora]